MSWWLADKPAEPVAELLPPDPEPPPQTAVERIVELVEMLYLREPGFTQEYAAGASPLHHRRSGPALRRAVTAG